VRKDANLAPVLAKQCN